MHALPYVFYQFKGRPTHGKEKVREKGSSTSDGLASSP